MTKSAKILCQKEKSLVFSNFFFCHYVFKKPSAAEASESIYMRERVKGTYSLTFFKDHPWDENNLVFALRWCLIAGSFMQKVSNYVSPHTWGDILFLPVPSVLPSVTLVSAQYLKNAWV